MKTCKCCGHTVPDFKLGDFVETTESASYCSGVGVVSQESGATYKVTMFSGEGKHKTFTFFPRMLRQIHGYVHVERETSGGFRFDCHNI
jgi:hypothetical protein